ncbi:MAG TPA: NAD-dependent deacylase [Crocinitomix sp.]|nr:NAD-dependent deacylase [Crocinitomix sp.]
MDMKIVVLTGAGISAESGLGTFRDSDGLWERFKIEEVATPEAWAKNPKLVLEFYNERRRQCLKAKPNSAHNALVELEKHFEVSIVTQNIDDLHERAGSKNVLHLHGEILKAKTSELSTEYYDIKSDIKLGDKGTDGKQLRPHVVWFGEAVPMLDKAIELTTQADVFIVIGTSLNVYPAASLLHYTSEKCITYIVDKEKNNALPASYKHLKANATVGVKKLVEELIKRK